MKLEQLLEGVPFTLVQGSLELDIEDIIYDSRKAAPGRLFVCIVGTQRDSHDYAAQCVADGVTALVVQHDIDLSTVPGAAVLKVESSRYALALMSGNLFGNPSRRMTMIGVTGTKGKTTTTHMIKSVLEAAGRKVGMIGTNGIYFLGHHQETANTTPESYELQKTFREFLDAGCDTALMEVSSQGLMMDRVAGIHYDIGVFTKLASVKTGDTLGLPGKTVRIKGMTYDEPMYKMAVYAKVKRTEDKIANGLVKLKEEDESFTYGNDPETKELIIAGVGDMQLSVLMAKLQSKYKVEAVLKPAKIAYRETIKKKVEIHGRHKKQSGGHGQFGDVFIEFEPYDTEELVFAERVVGGAVPKNFFPAVEKGIQESVQRGPLAAYPVVGVKATLYDGSYHPVDSSEMAFKTAASIAFKKGMQEAKPILLEPIMKLKITVPEEYMGDVMGDINKRRGRILGMEPNDKGKQVIFAEAPQSETFKYAIDLRAMTQGRGQFEMEIEKYEEVPAQIAKKIIEEAQDN